MILCSSRLKEYDKNYSWGEGEWGLWIKNVFISLGRKLIDKPSSIQAKTC